MEFGFHHFQFSQFFVCINRSMSEPIDCSFSSRDSIEICEEDEILAEDLLSISISPPEKRLLTRQVPQKKEIIYNGAFIEPPPENPFADYRIDSWEILQQHEDESARFFCPYCQRSRLFFCYDCVGLVGPSSLPPRKIPFFELPIAVDMYVNSLSMKIHQGVFLIVSLPHSENQHS